MQNVSHAVMAQRTEPRDSLDDFPTPPWATRALIECVLSADEVGGQSCLEPACGRGHMARPLTEYFGRVDASDIADYGFGPQRDFLGADLPAEPYDWVITNPPFRLAEKFLETSMWVARAGVALLTRTTFIESVGRYERLFRNRPPSIIAPFAERVPMTKGRLDRSASTATSYSWLVWRLDQLGTTTVKWIGPCRSKLEREDDYLGIKAGQLAI